MIYLIPWSEAIDALRRLLPECERVDPEVIATAAKAMGLSADFVEIANWESMTDEEILSILIPHPVDASEPIIAVTEASFLKATPFSFRQCETHEFVNFHFDNYNECVVNGDAVFIMPTRRKVITFHHSGYFSVIYFYI